jgi:hypothetical protein
LHQTKKEKELGIIYFYSETSSRWKEFETNKQTNKTNKNGKSIRGKNETKCGWVMGLVVVVVAVFSFPIPGFLGEERNRLLLSPFLFITM